MRRISGPMRPGRPYVQNDLIIKRVWDPPCDHKWSAWKAPGYTGDWFHPRIVTRTCQKCGITETDEH